ncbi:MAG: SRPBCC family protein [Bacteroidia bacterium]
MLQIILIILGSIIAIVLLAALVMSNEYSLSSSIEINRPKADVFNYIKYLKNQENYSKWVMADPNVKLVYTGTDGTVGFKAAWTSEMKNVGVGEQEITQINEGVGYHVTIRFEKPFKGESFASTTIENVSNNKSKLTTVFNTSTPFPMNLLSPLLKKMLVKDMDENSAKLKSILEN